MQKDKARKETDELLKQTEKRLAKIYAEAQNDIAKKWDAYMEDAAKKIAPFEKAYQEAKEAGDQEAIRNLGITLSREKNKITTQSDYYKDMLNYTTEQLAHTNEKALDYVNDQMPRVYGINYNGTIDQIKTDAGRIGMGVSFNLLDERTIRNLVNTDKLDLPRKQLEKYKDKAWNAKAINSQMIQGILQGETIPEMAARLQNVTDMNEAAANRNARTMTTSAENSGRMDGMKAAEEKGLVYEKQWMATNDDRTRESHAELDGESVPLDETFSNGLQYPGDPEGDPGEVYNCRCTMVRHLIGVRRRDGSIATIDEEEPELIFDLPETRQEREERLAREAEEKARQEAEAAKATEPEEPAEERTFTKAEQIELMEHYVSDEGFDMNRVARGEDKMINSQGYTKEEVEKFVEDFTQLLDQQSLDKETLVWRGSTADSIIASTGLTRDQILENPEELVGKTITEPGFISTTKDSIAANSYAQEDVLWDIELPEGAKAIHENELLPYLDTDEYTIQRDSSFEITDVYVRHFDENGNPYPNGGFIRISAKYVPETDENEEERKKRRK
jgi:SPP1 gp7 family putative phage head morphogenesis protein